MEKNGCCPMKKLFVFIISLFSIQNCLAQQIIWAKQFKYGVGLRTNVTLNSLNQKSDSSFIAGAEIWKFGTLIAISQTFYPGVGLIFLSSTGDTTKFINLFSNGRGLRIAMSPFNEIYAGVGVSYDTLLNSKIRIFKLDSEGNILWTRFLFAPTYDRGQVTKLMATPDGGCMVLGHAASVFGAWSDWFLLKYSFSGELEWSQRYNNGGTCEANNIEPMPGGNYLISGTVDNRIWSVVVDVNGQQLSNHFFHNSPNPYIVYGASVIQVPGKAFISSSSQNINNSYTSFVGKFDSLKAKVWGGYRQIGLLQPRASADGGYSNVEGQPGDSNYLRKYTPDSLLLWSVTIGKNSRGQFNDMVYDGFGSAVLAGYKKDALGTDNAYLVKVANMGLPFDPTKNKEIYDAEPFKKLIAYPNPCSENLYFKNVFYPSKIEVFDMLGRKKAQFQILPGEGVSLKDLPKGQYLVRVEAERKARVVRILKE